MPDLIPFADPADAFTGHASAAVTGCRFLRIAGPKVDGSPGIPGSGHYQVQHAAAAGHVFGVAMRDKPAGSKVGVQRSGIVPVECAVAMAAGTRVESDAAGRAVPLGTTAPAAGAPPTMSPGILAQDVAAGALGEIALSLT